MLVLSSFSSLLKQILEHKHVGIHSFYRENSKIQLYFCLCVCGFVSMHILIFSSTFIGSLFRDQSNDHWTASYEVPERDLRFQMLFYVLLLPV